MTPVLLDLFCCAGGASRGYVDAGFEVVGVDIAPQKNYPYEFVQMDALEYLDTQDLSRFSAIHASPPCQDYSRSMRHMQKPGKEKPRLIDDVRVRLRRSGVPWVIENVVGGTLPKAPTLWGEYGVLLCGTMFGLKRVWRHRLFETPFPIAAMNCSHTVPPLNPYNTASRIRDGLRVGSMKAYGVAMGIDWMTDTKKEVSEAIPPAFTRYIGTHLMAHITQGARA